MSEERAPSSERGRWSSRRKLEVVLRALRCEDLDALSREVGVRVERIVEEGDAVTVEARPTAPRVAGLSCGEVSARVLIRFVRTLRDLSTCGRPSVVRLTVRRFVCLSIAGRSRPPMFTSV